MIYTRNDTQENFRFCGKSLEFRPKRRELLTETKEIHQEYPSEVPRTIK